MMLGAKTDHGGVVSFAPMSANVMNFAGGLPPPKIEAQHATKVSDLAVMF